MITNYENSSDKSTSEEELVRASDQYDQACEEKRTTQLEDNKKKSENRNLQINEEHNVKIVPLHRK